MDKGGEGDLKCSITMTAGAITAGRWMKWAFVPDCHTKGSALAGGFCIVMAQPGWETRLRAGAEQTQVSCSPGVPMDSGTPHTGCQQEQV